MICPSKRCEGTIEVWAEGIDGEGREVEMGMCDTCGRLVTNGSDDQTALF